MEDRDVVVQREIADRAVCFFGVYDGHGGVEVADLASSRLDRRFFEILADGVAPADALAQAYADVAQATAAYPHTGSTACTATLVDGRLTAAWLGDSQLVIVTPHEVRFVATPHRLDDGGERARIIAAGGQIDEAYVMRGDYGLMVTRAFGDAWFNPIGVTATPSFATVELDAGVAHLIVLGSDGLWDVLRPDTVMELFGARERLDAFDYARTLVDFALEADTRDNVTVVTAEWRG